MTNCKNCPYTDEYCASGDCERDNNLTEQWKKGELTKIKQQLAIAVEALNWYDGLEKMLIGWEIATGQERGTAEKALCKIEELNK